MGFDVAWVLMRREGVANRRGARGNQEELATTGLPTVDLWLREPALSTTAGGLLARTGELGAEESDETTATADWKGFAA